MFSVMYVRSVFSSVLAMGDRNDMDKWFVPMLWFLFGFGMGIIAAHFQRWSIVLVFSAVLYMFVRYLVASGPRCLRCLMFMPLGPVELLFVLFEMANCTCVVVSCISSVGRFLIVWSMCLLILFVLYGVTFVNCLLNAFALSISVMVILVPKRMLLSCCVGGFFCWIVLLWCPTGSVDCVCDQFCQDVVSKCLLCVHVLACLCDC